MNSKSPSGPNEINAGQKCEMAADRIDPDTSSGPKLTFQTSFPGFPVNEPAPGATTLPPEFVKWIDGFAEYCSKPSLSGQPRIVAVYGRASQTPPCPPDDKGCLKSRRSFNLALSERRAEAVLARLASAGIDGFDESAVDLRPLGEDSPWEDAPGVENAFNRSATIEWELPGVANPKASLGATSPWGSFSVKWVATFDLIALAQTLTGWGALLGTAQAGRVVLSGIVRSKWGKKSLGVLRNVGLQPDVTAGLQVTFGVLEKNTPSGKESRDMWVLGGTLSLGVETMGSVTSLGDAFGIVSVVGTPDALQSDLNLDVARSGVDFRDFDGAGVLLVQPQFSMGMANPGASPPWLWFHERDQNGYPTVFAEASSVSMSLSGSLAKPKLGASLGASWGVAGVYDDHVPSRGDFVNSSSGMGSAGWVIWDAIRANTGSPSSRVYGPP